MRILFVSGTTVGGSGRSQRELAGQLALRGHDVLFLVDDDRPAPGARWAYGHLSDLSVRLAGRSLGSAVSALRDSIGGRTSSTVIDGQTHHACALPQNALARELRDFGPDVVVVSSVERWAWRQISARCASAGTPTILYVREMDTLGHLDTGSMPTVLVANARSLAQRLRSSGFTCSFIPSVVATTTTQTSSERRVALSINPVVAKGGDLFWEIAARLPQIPFVIQESWPLSDRDLHDVEARVASSPNVEFRRRAPAGPGLYRDARVLLVPYRVDSRPRVILEAQANGIPVVVGDVAGLVEAVGDGGVVVPLESVDEWVAAVQRMWEDQSMYEALSAAALAHSGRAEVDPVAITSDFEGLLELAAAHVGT
jgi:glycosyltransferase involved in cell wall biosynthesis